MARAKGTSGRSTKTPSLAGNAFEDPESKRDPGSDIDSANVVAAPQTATPEVTNSTLQRRELPSLSDDRATRIAEAAYWRAERRGFEPGRELDDWLDAEREVDGPH